MTETAEPDSRLANARGLVQQGQFQTAMELALQVLEQDPAHEEGLYLLAVCQRYLSQFDKALETLAKLQSVNAAYARAWQEAGHIYRASFATRPAIDAYRKAVSLNPALLTSWRALVALAGEAGNTGLQQEAVNQAGYLSSLPPELLSVSSMMHEGKLFKAEQLCRHYLQQHPKHVEGMRLLAAIGVKNDILDDAEFLLESAVVFEPDNAMARLDYVNVLYRRQKFKQSMEQAGRLRSAYPDDPAVKMAYANQSMAVSDFDTAITLYDEMSRELPNNHTLHLTYAHALKTVGNLEAAIESYRQAYRAKPDFGDAYWSLANLKTYRFTDDEILAMEHLQAASSTTLEDRVHLCFALDKHYEDSEDFDASFNFYERGNRLRKQQLDYSADKTTRRLNLQREICTRELFERRQGTGDPSPDPIFIVGLPRAGSTLLEQILASHSGVDGTMELQNITGIAQKLDGRRRVDDPARYPKILGDISAGELHTLGAQYIEDTQIHRQGAPFFIDKLPNNFVHIGLIHLILPNAKIIDARRHPMGCCFSGFKQLFASGQEYTYGLTEIGQYYKDYVELMDHWDTVLPGKVLRVQYENVVADLEGQVKRILDYCKLPFEEACLTYYETDRSVRTPSSEQVRQPIFQSGVEQWRNFEAWLGPLKEALGPITERYPVS